MSTTSDTIIPTTQAVKSMKLLSLLCLCLNSLKWNIDGNIKAIGVQIPQPTSAIRVSNLFIERIPTRIVPPNIKILIKFSNI